MEFEAWAALSARLSKRSEEERAALLSAEKVEPEAYRDADRRWSAAIEADLAAGKPRRAERYGAACAAEVARRRRPAPPAEPCEAAPVAATAEDAEVDAPHVVVPSFLREPEQDHGPSPSFLDPPDAPSFGGTMIAPAPHTGAPRPAVPFGAQPSPEFVEYLASPPEAATEAPPSDKGGTMVVPAADGPAAAPPTQVRGFTLQQYASLTVELSVWREQAPSVLARYGLPDDADRHHLAEAWGRALMQDRDLLRRFTDLCDTYRAWLLRQGR
jgi:hypothetical protein